MRNAERRVGKYFGALIVGVIYLYILWAVVDALSKTSPGFAALVGVGLVAAAAYALYQFAKRGF